MNIKKVNEILELSVDRVGSIKHYVSLKEGRVTFYKDAYMRETCHITVTTAATLDEIKSLAEVINGLVNIMESSIPPKKEMKKEKHPSGKKGFLLTFPNGKQVSVLDFKDVMKSAPKEIKQAVYLGWEAWDGEQSYRGYSYEEVEKMVKDKYLK